MSRLFARAGVVERPPVDIELPRQPNPLEAVVQRYISQVLLTAYRSARSAPQGLSIASCTAAQVALAVLHIGHHVLESHRALVAIIDPPSSRCSRGCPRRSARGAARATSACNTAHARLFPGVPQSADSRAARAERDAVTPEALERADPLGRRYLTIPEHGEAL
jgi:hypothetical protein